MSIVSHKISIGKLSDATCIPIPTIRTWERRYQFPRSERTEGNHRLYDVSLVEHLRLVVKALENGHRAKQVLGLSIGKLEQLIGLIDVERNPSFEECVTLQPSEALDRLFEQWLKDAKNLDTKACLANFRMSLSHLGLRGFVVERVVPFLTLLGLVWRRGELQVFQEHFATRLLTQFMEEQWQNINTSNAGEIIIISSHPLEKHTLGLHLVASMLVLDGYSVLMLGNNTPVEEIVACAVQTNAYAVAISLSVTMERLDSLHFLNSLHKRISDVGSKPSPFIVVGGSGAYLDPANRWLVHSNLDSIGHSIQDFASRIR